jgi:hypothetical protein
MMAASPTLQAIEFIALRSEELGEGLCEPAVRTQVAFVLALLDEILRRQESDTAVAPLLVQVEEEVERLTRLLCGKHRGAASS